MIIIKIIILYFIQIRHTDDFPSTGTRLVSVIDVTTYRRLFPTVFLDRTPWGMGRNVAVISRTNYQGFVLAFSKILHR